MAGTPKQDKDSFAAGAFAGVGAGVTVTNAGNVAALKSTTNTSTLILASASSFDKHLLGAVRCVVRHRRHRGWYRNRSNRNEQCDGNSALAVREKTFLEDSVMVANGCKPIRILRVITISALLLCAPVGYVVALIGLH